MSATRSKPARVRYTRTTPRTVSIRARVEVQPVKVTALDERGRAETLIVDLVEFCWDPTYESSPHALHCWGHRPDVPLDERDDALRVHVAWQRVTVGGENLRRAVDEARRTVRLDMSVGAPLP